MTIKTTSLCISLLLLTSCSSIFVNHNVKPYITQKAQDTLQSGVVDEYTRNEIWQLDTVNLGLVSGEYCQGRASNIGSTKSYLIDKLKIKTQQLGGNGFVFDSCFQESNGSCHNMLSCKGIAYLVNY